MHERYLQKGMLASPFSLALCLLCVNPSAYQSLTQAQPIHETQKTFSKKKSWVIFYHFDELVKLSVGQGCSWLE